MKASASAPISARHAAQYYRPSRAGYKGGRACEAPDLAVGLAAPERAVVQSGLPPLAVQLPDADRAGARRALSAASRSTYLPLACTGATIAEGLFGLQRARDCLPSKSAVRARAEGHTRNWHELRDAVTAAKRRQPDRQTRPACCCRSAPTTSILPGSSPT